MSEQQAMRDC